MKTEKEEDLGEKFIEDENFFENHTHLLLKGDVTDLVDYYWKSNNYGDNRGIKHLSL